jgi:hypothetical protein
MTAEEMFAASLAGVDQGELITIPALPDIADWKKSDEARKALAPNSTASTRLPAMASAPDRIEISNPPISGRTA